MDWKNIVVNVIAWIQGSKALGITLMTVNSVLLSYFTNQIQSIGHDHTRDNSNGAEWWEKLLTFICHVIPPILLYLGEIAVAFFLVAAFGGSPNQGEDKIVLLKRIFDYYRESFLIPVGASVITTLILRIKVQHSKLLLTILLIPMAMISGIEFFVDAIRIMQRPNLPLPMTTVSAVINYRLHSYPFALSAEYLDGIGDGSALLTDSENNPGLDTSTNPPDSGETIYDEPSDFNGYMTAILRGTYAPGKGEIDYLRSAYELYENGQYGEIDYDYISVMWLLIYDDFPYFNDLGFIQTECLKEALNAVEAAVQKNGENFWRYNEMILVYGRQNNYEEIRRCAKLALELASKLGTDKMRDSNNLDYYRTTIRYYKDWIRHWVDSEKQYSWLMDDASTVLDCDEDLSMYILYGACAISESENVSEAYERLCNADKYCRGKSAMVKILRCICAELLGEDESELLGEIYTLEQENGLMPEEEIYLIRYLFCTNRYEELWGYISDVGNADGTSPSTELVAIKASWFFRNQGDDHFATEDVEQLLDWVENQLNLEQLTPEERELLLLSRAELQSCLGLEVGVGTDVTPLKGISYLEHFLSAVGAYNTGKYQDAIQFCDLFVQSVKEDASSPDDSMLSWNQLMPQEQMILQYYIQLTSACSHFEYASPLPKNSNEWKLHMDAAERECDAFQESTKSLSYIRELFITLKNSIDMAHGRIPEDPNGGKPSVIAPEQ